MKYNDKIIRYMISAIIIVVAFLFINSGIDLMDSGYSLNAYQFIFSNPETTTMSTVFTSITGNILIKLFNTLNIPIYLGFKAIVSIINLICVYVVYRTLEKYFNKTSILIGLLLAVIFSKGFINIFMYNHSTTLFFVLAVAALIKGVLEDKQLFIILSGAIIGFNIFMRIPNVVEIIIALSIVYWGIYKRDLKKASINLASFILGFIVSIIVSLLIINSIFGIKDFVEMLTRLSNNAKISTSGYSIYDMLRANITLGIQGIIYLIIFQIVSFILLMITRNFMKDKQNNKIIYFFSLIIPILYFIFKFIGLHNISILSVVLKPIYARTYTIITPITLIVAFLGIYTLYISFKINKNNKERTFIIVTILLMTLAIPIGSNTYFYLFTLNMFFQCAVVVDILREILFKNYEGKYGNLIIVVRSNLIIAITYSIIMIFIKTVNYSFGDTPRVYEGTINNKKLIGMYTNRERSSAINGVLNNIPINIKEGTKIITHNIPLFATLLDMPPFFDGCNGWSGLSGVTNETVIENLTESEITKEYPLIIISKKKDNDEINKDQKLKYIYKYINNNNYKKMYENDYYIIYYFK